MDIDRWLSADPAFMWSAFDESRDESPKEKEPQELESPAGVPEVPVEGAGAASPSLGTEPAECGGGGLGFLACVMFCVYLAASDSTILQRSFSAWKFSR